MKTGIENIGAALAQSGDKLRRRVHRRKYKSEIEKGRYIPNPEWEESDVCRDEVMNQCLVASVKFGGAHEEFLNYYPQDCGKRIPEEGAWVTVIHPPSSEYTVPPMSIWYATNWPMDRGQLSGVRVKRAKIITPAGELGLFPRDYFIVKNIREYVGREKDGVIFRNLGGDAVFPIEQMFYLQSRGIKRAEAAMMLLDQMHDSTFGWFEIAPAYGDAFGEPWPSRERCPFATPANLWLEDKAA